VNRLIGEIGPCHAGTEARVFHAQTEVSDEWELAPVFAVAFSGCDLRCDFCNTGRESWDPRAGQLVSAQVRRESIASIPTSNFQLPTSESEPPHVGSRFAELAARARHALDHGARSVMLLGGEPTIHLPAALEFAAQLPDDATLVWKTNAHATAEARALLDGVFDVWVADYKFGNDECAQRLAKVSNYCSVVRENLCWAAKHADLIVRHLLMPGHVECCWKPVAEWLAAELPGVKVSLRTGFWPGWFSSRHPELHTTSSVQEEQEARRIAADLGLRIVA
jgi:putative pyruvate formate lyase activating enzyme